MQAATRETIWRRPEGGWIRPEYLARALGVTPAAIVQMVRSGALLRRASDGCIWVEGLDPAFLGGTANPESATLATVARMLQEVRVGFMARDTSRGLAADNLGGAAPEAPAPPPEPGKRSRWFAFPFGISL